MGKKASEENVLDKIDFQGKTNKELEEIIVSLDTQLQQYQTMAIKAQGAIEVITQMISEKKEVDES